MEYFKLAIFLLSPALVLIGYFIYDRWKKPKQFLFCLWCAQVLLDFFDPKVTDQDEYAPLDNNDLYKMFTQQSEYLLRYPDSKFYKDKLSKRDKAVHIAVRRFGLGANFVAMYKGGTSLSEEKVKIISESRVRLGELKKQYIEKLPTYDVARREFRFFEANFHRILR